jgi:hypothetical protein
MLELGSRLRVGFNQIQKVCTFPYNGDTRQDKTRQAKTSLNCQFGSNQVPKPMRTQDLHSSMNMVAAPYFQPIVGPKPSLFFLRT